MATQEVATAGNVMPTRTTAVHRSTTVSGATPVSMIFSHVGGSITGVQPTIRGTGLLTSLTNLTPKTVTARLGEVVAPCTQTAGSVLSQTLGLEEATYDCAPLSGRADRPPPLVITVR